MIDALIDGCKIMVKQELYSVVLISTLYDYFTNTKTVPQDNQQILQLLITRQQTNLNISL